MIVTPASHHAEAILETAALGCPIFCEKPLTVDLDRRDAILAACGDRLSVMHKWRWHPGVERLAALAAEGAIGDVTGVRATRLGGGDAHVGADSLDTLAAHDLSIGLAMLGRLPAVRAAHGTRWPGDPSVGWVEATAILADAGGPGLMVDVSAVGAQRLRRVEVTGTRGSAVLPEPEAPAAAPAPPCWRGRPRGRGRGPAARPRVAAAARASRLPRALPGRAAAASDGGRGLRGRASASSTSAPSSSGSA